MPEVVLAQNQHTVQRVYTEPLRLSELRFESDESAVPILRCTIERQGIERYTHHECTQHDVFIYWPPGILDSEVKW